MPFVLRTVEPKFLSRTSLHDENGTPKVKDDELLAVTNCTLSNALRQLASLMVLANDIFGELTNQLNDIGERSKTLQLKITLVDEKVQEYDPKKVPVPVSDLTTFAARKIHFNSKPVITTSLFVEDTRPKCLRELYTKAGILDGQGGRSPRSGRRSPMVQCTPVLGGRRRKLREKVDVDIETGLPAAIEELRKWTSTEALGEPTVAPDGLQRVSTNLTMADGEMSAVVSSDDEEPLDHKLPSPEEQFNVIATKFQPEVVTIDTSGRRFDRMCNSRRSLLHADHSCDRTQNGDSQTVKRRTRSRKPRGKRRNTITGTDQKEIRDAIAGDTTSPVDSGSPESGAVIRSHSSDLLKKSPYDIQSKKSHFNTLKEWGRSRLRLMSRSPSDSGRDSSKAEKSKASKSPTVQDIDDINIYETVTMRRKRNSNKQQDRKISHERNNSYSSSERSVSLPVTAPLSGAMSLAVKLREANIAGRRRRTAVAVATGREEPHSSSGNWSASSESGRTSIGSEITSTTAAPRSSTSAATSSNSLNVLHGPPSSIVSRRRFLNTSGSGSVTSEGTLTPDIIHDLHDDMETSSEFSCDTEGYYTSFHMDSGLKTLKEEEISLPITPLHTTNTFTNSSGNQTAENEYELFGKGSTSTTTSSAGTVCTTLLAACSERSLTKGPTVPERKSSLSKLNKSRSSSNSSNVNVSTSSNENTNTIKRNSASKNDKITLVEDRNKIVVKDGSKETTVVVDIHQIKVSNTGAESPDSGHNTSSSPVDDSLSSAHGGKISCGGSELDYSESSDLEGVDGIEGMRVKTTINSSRIPSMCVITPNNSDDESTNSSKQDTSDMSQDTEKANISHRSSAVFEDPEEENKIKKRISSRPKLDLPPQETDLDTLVFNDSVTDEPTHSAPLNVMDDPETETNKQSIISNIISKRGKNKKQTTSKTIEPQKASNRTSFIPLNNLMCRIKDALPQKLRKSSTKDLTPAEPVYEDNGEYVTIADVKNNNKKINANSGVYYSNDVVKRNLQTVLSGKLQETEYVSLNELPSNISADSTEMSSVSKNQNSKEHSAEYVLRHGARVTLDSNGKVIYSSDSLKRRKGAHTTFEPGPFVKDVIDGPVAKDLENISPTANVDVLKNTTNIRSSPVTIVGVQEKPGYSSRPLSPQLGKVVIRAPNLANNKTIPTSEVVRLPPTNIVTPNTVIRPMSPRMMSRGAYVNIQDAEGVSLSPTKDNDSDYRHSSADRASPGHPVYLPPQVNMHSKNYAEMAKSVDYETLLYSKDDMAAHRATIGLYSQLPTRRQGNVYWTLQPKRPQPHLASETNNYHRSVTPDITRGLYSYPTVNNSLQTQFHQTNPNVGVQNIMNIPSEPYYSDVEHYQHPRPLNPPPNIPTQNIIPNQNLNVTSRSFVTHQNQPTSRFSSSGRDVDNFTMSPIDPRQAGKFQSSTPTRNIPETSTPIRTIPDGDNTLLADKIASPVKSTMSNEELYAVIHKSKKRMNIKSPPLDRAGSPALSINSLSPGSSESSITGRITPVKMPETGYLNDARTRHSWSPNFQDNDLVSDLSRPPLCGSPRPNATSCADRLGPAAQTSRLDFKKLLLQHGVRLNLQHHNKPPAKVSAVERLKLSKETNPSTTTTKADQSKINILDLSGSPKTYVNRRMMRISNNPAPSSPSRTNILIKEHKATPKILLSPKTQWRFSSPRSDVLSSPIPEAFNEDESPNSSNEKDHKQIISDFSRKMSFDVRPSIRRSLIPTIKENIATDSAETDDSVVPLSSVSPLKNNIFLAAQENNFTKQEQQALNTFGQPQIKLNLHEKLTRAEILQQQKAQFLSQDFSNARIKCSVVPAQFKIPNKITETSSPQRDKEKSPSPPTLETAL